MRAPGAWFCTLQQDGWENAIPATGAVRADGCYATNYMSSLIRATSYPDFGIQDTQLRTDSDLILHVTIALHKGQALMTPPRNLLRV